MTALTTAGIRVSEAVWDSLIDGVARGFVEARGILTNVVAWSMFRFTELTAQFIGA